MKRLLTILVVAIGAFGIALAQGAAPPAVAIEPDAPVWKRALVGIVSGAFSAILVDLDAWKKSTGSFNWALASRRWLYGAASGFAAIFGMKALGF